MKWSLQQLMKYTQKPFLFEGTYEFKDYIDSIDDILDISEINVKGSARRLYDDRYEFTLNITGNLVLEDARTLEPVAYPIDLDVIETFDRVVGEEEDVRYIEKNTIDLKDIVWENILLEKPIRFVKED